MDPKGEGEESGDADEADDGGSHQAAGAAQWKPKQGTENLAAIERIDGEHIEDQQAGVDPHNCVEKCVGIRHGLRPSQ
jgi:hypothetical protein